MITCAKVAIGFQTELTSSEDVKFLMSHRIRVNGNNFAFDIESESHANEVLVYFRNRERKLRRLQLVNCTNDLLKSDCAEVTAAILHLEYSANIDVAGYKETTSIDCRRFIPNNQSVLLATPPSRKIVKAANRMVVQAGLRKSLQAPNIDFAPVWIGGKISTSFVELRFLEEVPICVAPHKTKIVPCRICSRPVLIDEDTCKFSTDPTIPTELLNNDAVSLGHDGLERRVVVSGRGIEFMHRIAHQEIRLIPVYNPDGVVGSVWRLYQEAAVFNK